MRRRGPGICYAFQRGECHRGPRCQYSHEPAARNTRQGTKRDKHTTSPELDNWKDMAFQKSPLGFGLGKFFSQALRLVQLDDACRQEVIKSLATDKGLNKVLELVSQKFEGISEKALVHIFVSQLSPFFRVLSEEHVMSSPLLERHLGDICQFLYGVGGSRGERLFAAVIQALSALLQKSDIEFFTSLEASLAVLLKLVEFNSTAKVTPCFTTYATALAAMLTPQSDPAADNLRYQATKHLDNINKRLGIGTSIRNIGSVNGQDASTASKPIFSLQCSLPGRLPNGRPRHNNDYDPIEKIQIMPTSEEIQSTHAEYLPLQDPSTWHKTGVTGLIDRHFRLLREDTIGQLRDSARVEFEALQGMEPQRGKSTLRRHTYRNVLVELPKFDSLRGLEFVISFDQPPELRSKSKKQRQDWWAHSKRLEGDALICLISSTRAFVFCSVCFPHDQSKRFAKDMEKVPDIHQNIVSHSDNRVRVIARPSEMNAESIAHILGIFSQKDFQGGRSLVEFPGVLLPAFLPTLTALKAISRSGNLPFSDFLAPSQGSGESTVVVPPPAYAQRAGFRFELDSIIQDETSAFDPTKLKQADIDSLQKASSLDDTQASALLSSLSRSFALIQGPPGTGKSYTGVALMKTLVSNKKAAALGPILVVIFTNHALDQSLKHLLDHCITQIIRLGSNSRSERMADINLRKVAATVERTKAQNSEYGKTRGQMDDEIMAITHHLHSLSRATQNVREYLAQNHPNYHAQIYGAGRDADGWEEDNRTLQTITRVANVNELSNNERRLLHDYWLGMAQKRILDAINNRAKTFKTLKLRLDAIKNETDLRVLNQANVIGVTTSGLARNLELLRKLPSKILLCEEAGEVLESHLLTALLPSVEHAILIGDHLQLRPHVQYYNLSQESARGQQHALDTSLFERLVTATDGGARLPFSRLDTQRRMHPDIAELVRTTLYPTLSNAPSTLEHAQVVGLKKRLFWLDHQQPETQSDLQSTSHTNDYEVEMTTALVSHLIKQGVHKPGAIAVLTPYVGQLKKLQLRMQNAFEVVLDDRDIKVLKDGGLEDSGLDDAAQSRAPPAPGVQKGSMASAVRIATVDNFQGEEADVVVISLVRSNDQQKCGFLRTSNRINVLLSRAKNGMYIIGNSNTTQHIPMWMEVLQLLQMNGNIACPMTLFDWHLMAAATFHVANVYYAAMLATALVTLKSFMMLSNVSLHVPDDQSTLKFITWSNNYYIEYYGSFSKAQKDLQKNLEDARPAQTSLHLYGSRDQQIYTIRTTMSRSRYKEIVELRWKINEFRGLVNKNEQPFKRVQALVRHARLNKRTEEDFTFDESVILQTRSYSLATSLLIRCDLVILSDVLAVRSSVALPVNVATTLDLNKNRKDCETLFQLADEGKHYLQQAEALIFWAHFAALEVSWRSSHEEESDENNAIITLRTQARQRLEQARVFCAEHSQARIVASEIEEIEKMLRESTFYQLVTTDEMQKVVAAMTREFRGTGHWYRCRNGHPFTVGECGMPMQRARCPQCGEVVGGQHHQAAEGVTHAGDIERDSGNMRL
ncbi:hypothetical protein KCU98_g8248, partial [Aureobasidium melanogenum]